MTFTEKQKNTKVNAQKH